MLSIYSLLTITISHLAGFPNMHLKLFLKFSLWSFNVINDCFWLYCLTLDDKIIKTLLHARKLILFNKHEVWVKKENPDFDVTMGSFDGLEVCELVGLYLLDILKKGV